MNKALLSWRGQTFLQSIVARLDELGDVRSVVVVAAPHGAETEAVASELGIACLHNGNPERGMASSVSIGFAHAMENFSRDACWLWPVDAPGVDISTLRALRRQACVSKILTPRFSGRGGHPSLVGRAIWPELQACESEAEGARTVFRRDEARRLFVEVNDKAVRNDIDSPADLEALSC